MGCKTCRNVCRVILLALFGLGLIIPAGLGMAQEEATVRLTATAEESPEAEIFSDTDEMVAEELAGDIMIAFGTLAAVADAEGELTVLEYDFDTDQDVKIIYMIDEDTEYENITDASQLVVGDPVELIYVEMDGKRIALVVTKEQLDLDEALLEGEDDLEMEMPVMEDEEMPDDLLAPVEEP